MTILLFIIIILTLLSVFNIYLLIKSLNMSLNANLKQQESSFEIKFNAKITESINKSIEKHGNYVILGGMLCLIAVVIAAHHIIYHLKYYFKPKLQLYIVRILLMVPVRIYRIIH